MLNKKIKGYKIMVFLGIGFNIQLMKLKKTGLIISFIIIFFYIAGYDLTTYEYTEQFSATDIVIKKLFIPIFLISVICSVMIIRYAYNRGRLIKSKYNDNLKAIGLFIIALVGITFLSFAFFQGAVLMTNRIIGIQKDIVINGKIIDFKELKSKNKTSYYIDIRDKNINRTISLRVNSRYTIGDDFNRQMKIGCLGLIYKK